MKNTFNALSAVGRQEFIDEVTWGEVKKVAKFLDQYPDAIAACDEYGRTPLMLAAWNGKKDIVGLLIEKGARLDDLCGKSSNTALMYAAENGHTEIVELLLEKGASQSRNNIFGKNALKLAQECRHPETVALLTEWRDKEKELKRQAAVAKDIASFSPGLKRAIPAPRSLQLRKAV
jgi:hypothetical protein